ncbi:hypothetical protein Tco_1261104 [Tanacetum coccineum]
MFVIEQPLPATPAADSMHKCCHNGMQFMMHIMRLLVLYSVRFDQFKTSILQTKEGTDQFQPMSTRRIYVDQLERLGYMLPQDLIVGLILNGLTKDFAGFVRNYNMHNMGKTIGELHAMLIEYEKGLPKKAETPQVMMIKGGKIQKAKKKSLKAKGKGNETQLYPN